MKKIATIMAAALAAMAHTRCDDEADFTSHYYYSYEAGRQISASSLGIDAFQPYTVAMSHDTLFIANTASSQSLSLIVYSLSQNRVLTTLSQWQADGQTMTFNPNGDPRSNRLDIVHPAGGRLYVGETASRIHVFSLPGLEWIATIGNGAWGGEVFQAQAGVETGGLFFARDKDSRISVYRVADMAGNGQTRRYKRAAGTGSANNGFQPHSMCLDEEGRIVMTEYDARRIRFLDPALVSDTMPGGANIDIAGMAIETDFNPRTVALTSERLYVSGVGGGNRIFVYDRAEGQWMGSFARAKGFTFSNPQKVYAQNDTALWVSDAGNNTLVKVNVFRNEIRAY